MNFEIIYFLLFVICSSVCFRNFGQLFRSLWNTKPGTLESNISLQAMVLIIHNYTNKTLFNGKEEDSDFLPFDGIAPNSQGSLSGQIMEGKVSVRIRNTTKVVRVLYRQDIDRQRWFVAIGIFSVFNETKNHNSWPLLTGNYSMGSSGVPTTPSAGNPNLNFVTRLFPTNTTKGLIARDDALLYVKDSEFQVTGDFSVTSETIVLRISQTNTEKKCDLSLIRKKRCKELSYTVIVHDEENYFAMMKTGFIIGLLMLSVSLLIIAVSIYSRRKTIFNKSI